VNRSCRNNIADRSLGSTWWRQIWHLRRAAKPTHIL